MVCFCCFLIKKYQFGLWSDFFFIFAPDINSAIAMKTVQVLDKTFEVMIDQGEILGAIERVAAQINADFADEEPVFVCVLNGAFMFAADLLKRVVMPCDVSFVKLSSYEGTSSTGQVKELIGLGVDVKDRAVVLIEDIVDTGATIKMLIDKMLQLGARRVATATLLFKPEACRKDVVPEYVALQIPSDFIIGYGLDYDGRGRNLQDIYKLKNI